MNNINSSVEFSLIHSSVNCFKSKCKFSSNILERNSLKNYRCIVSIFGITTSHNGINKQPMAFVEGYL